MTKAVPLSLGDRFFLEGNGAWAFFKCPSDIGMPITKVSEAGKEILTLKELKKSDSSFAAVNNDGDRFVSSSGKG